MAVNLVKPWRQRKFTYRMLIHVVIITCLWSFTSWKLMLPTVKPDCADTLLCMFTTFKPEKEKLQVRICIIQNFVHPAVKQQCIKNLTTSATY